MKKKQEAPEVTKPIPVRRQTMAEAMAEVKKVAKTMPKENRTEFINSAKKSIQRREDIWHAQKRQETMTNEIEPLLLKHGVTSYLLVVKIPSKNKVEGDTGWGAVQKVNNEDALEIPTVVAAAHLRLLKIVGA